MTDVLQNASLRHAGLLGETSIYGLLADGLSCNYYVVSNQGTRRLMMFPEVTGYDSYLSMVPPTADMLRFLYDGSLAREKEDGVTVLTILRGGLNYPIEECCHRVGLPVSNINFLSCERIIEGHRITGLDIKYQKLHVCKDCTLLIGDIIATGDTLSLCLEHAIREFRDNGGSIKRIIFFTVGGTRAICHLEDLDKELKSIWPDFEGIKCIFYEGIFTVYEDKGVTGVSVPDIDFKWAGGAVAPEFREAVLDDDDALYEKCIIYDGGARRYEIPAHYDEVVEYWEDILKAAGQTDITAFMSEKLGYPASLSYEAWLEANHYSELGGADLKELYAQEMAFAGRQKSRQLADIAERRLSEFKGHVGKYVNKLQ